MEDIVGIWVSGTWCAASLALVTSARMKVRSSSVAMKSEVPGEAARETEPEAMAGEGEAERDSDCFDWSARAMARRNLTLAWS